MADTFTLDKRWVLDLCDAIIKEDIDINWLCNSRADTIDEEMKLRGFSNRTIKTYSYHIKEFLAFCGEYSPEKKRAYLLCLIEKEYNPASVRLTSSAIDFYVRVILRQEPINIPLPKKEKKLPDVLTKEQIKGMINSTMNIKHQLIIEILYSSGLRLSELLNL